MSSLHATSKFRSIINQISFYMLYLPLLKFTSMDINLATKLIDLISKFHDHMHITSYEILLLLQDDLPSSFCSFVYVKVKNVLVHTTQNYENRSA